MINPQDIDLTSLPWLPLEEKGAFPKRPSIYFAIDSLGNVQYIGRSVNTKRRWGNHHKYNDLTGISGVRIAYLFVDSPELLPGIEKALIQGFQPPLNFVDNPAMRVKAPRERCKKARLASSSPSLEMISSRDNNAELVKVFLHREEKEILKQVAAKQGIPVSHLMRALALQWLEQNESA